MLEKKLNAWFREMPDSGSFQKAFFGKDMFALGSDIGTKRNENQDRLGAIWVNAGASSERSFCTFVLCDGMGGMKDGSGSAATAISSFLSNMVLGRRLNVETRLRNAALGANEAVKINNGGGSTLSAITISNARIYSLNVGDSRIYSVNANVGVNRHSRDDNLKEAFGGEGEELLQYIGMGEGIRPHIDEIKNDFDFLFLTSDGVHNLESGVFEKVALNSRSPSEICKRLIKTAIWTGGRDNASVAAISKNMLSSNLQEQKGAEITVWCQKGELQVIWADEPQELSNQQIEQFDRRSQPVPTADLDLIDRDELDLKGGQDNRVKDNKPRKKPRRKAKESFGDLERD